jgi:hypothetical protein
VGWLLEPHDAIRVVGVDGERTCQGRSEVSISRSLSGFDAHTAIAKFYNRDDENAVGFEMRMTFTEYNALCRFINQACKDTAECATAALSERVRSVLSATGESK